MFIDSNDNLSKEYIKELLKTYYYSSDVSILCVDRNNKTLAACTNSTHINNFVVSDHKEIYDFISREKSKNANFKGFYTYLSSYMLTYNIAYLYNRRKNYIGALIAGPMLNNALNNDMLEKIIRDKSMPLRTKRIINEFLANIPKTSPTKSLYLGRLLWRLFKTDAPTQQILFTSKHQRKAVDFSNPKLPQSENLPHIPHELLKEVEKEIIKGNLSGVQKFIDEVFTFPPAALAGNDEIRSAKNNFIGVSSITCNIAISGGADYEIAKTLSDDYIRTVEKLDTMEDIINQFKKMFISFTKLVSKHSNPNCSKPVHDAIQYICSHYSETITLETLAAHVNLSTSYFSEIFKKQTEVPLRDYINRIRIDESKYLLLNTTLSILEVSIAIGFEYQNYFTKVFKKFVGLTPKEYRTKRGLVLIDKP